MKKIKNFLYIVIKIVAHQIQHAKTSKVDKKIKKSKKKNKTQNQKSENTNRKIISEILHNVS